MEIEYLGRKYYFKNTENEEDKLFTDRCWFIVKNQHIENESLLLKLSYIYVFKKYYGCSYSSNIEEILETCEHTISLTQN